MTLTMPPAIKQILDWQAQHLGALVYSQVGPDRLNPNALTTPTDCSGNLARLFKHFAGIDIGTYTGNECNSGHLVTTNKGDVARGVGLLPGDCVLFDWDGGNWDHIAMYAGDGQIYNHGGPANGPQSWSLAQSVGWASKVMVRRMIPWQSAPSSPLPFPLPKGHTFLYGSHGQPVTLIQERLIKLGYLAPGNTGGNYLDLTRTAVKAFQRRQHGWLFPTGKVGAKTWARLFAVNAPAAKKKG